MRFPETAVRVVRDYELQKENSMEARVNQLIEEPVVVEVIESKPVPPKKLGRVGMILKDVLGGDFLAYDWSKRQLNFIVFLAAIAVFYISNSYYAESVIRRIDDTNRELKELHYEYISGKSKVMNLSKQSVLIKKLEKTGLKESIEPVRKIIANKNDQ